MFRYFEYSRVTEGGEIMDLIVPGKVEANVLSFGGNDFIVSVSGEDADITAFAQMQHSALAIEELTVDAFMALAKESEQIRAINYSVAREIAKRYSIADEIGMMKRAETDQKRVAYEAYVDSCKTEGDARKAELGYA
ncbi:hypothetical protein WCX72_10005 [Sulfurimonas sp. HSL1-6]|uniref:hypothetical protein n=1 Tax=Thiomicrolovo immobilis TaxID=3131935 RepID=UPI0031F7C23A